MTSERSHTTQRTTVLLLALDNWLGIARLPKALQAVGFAVTVITPRGSFLSRTRYIDRLITLPTPLNGNDVIAAFVQTFADQQPALIIPGDEAATDFLWRISNASLEVQQHVGLQTKALELIDLSLGGKDFKNLLRSKTHVNQLALDEGLAVPFFSSFTSYDEVASFANVHGFPVIVKPDSGFAGVGVGIVRSELELRETFPLIAQYSHASGDLPFYIQQFVNGKVAMYPFACWRGKVLTGFGGYKERCHPAITGPTSVIRRVDHQGMADAAKRLMRRTEFTGFGSIDFIIDDNGTAHLLELNARPVPLTHLGGLLGADLCAVLYREITGTAAESSPTSKIHDVIALYPQEKLRDSSSRYLTTVHVDIPIDDDELYQSYEQEVQKAERRT
jgi:carbamoyl-phosphate synthase large subunit